MSIHPAAIVDPKSEIDSGVEIGPYVVIEGQVKIKRGTRVMAHAYLTGCTEIGEDNEIHPGAVLGGFLIGITETMVAGYLSSTYKDAVAFAILILILLFRPSGLLGSTVQEKV